MALSNFRFRTPRSCRDTVLPLNAHVTPLSGQYPDLVDSDSRLVEDVRAIVSRRPLYRARLRDLPFLLKAF